MSNFVHGNLRNRLFCSVSWEELSEFFPTLIQLKSNSDPVQICKAIRVAMKDSKSAQDKLQMISFARKIDCELPENKNNELCGVVVEFSGDYGIDALAAYSDCTASFFESASQKLMEVDCKNDPLKTAHIKFFDAIKHASMKIGSALDIPAIPPPGFVQITVFTDKGIAFGLGEMREMATDSRGGPIIFWALELRKIICNAAVMSAPM